MNSLWVVSQHITEAEQCDLTPFFFSPPVLLFITIHISLSLRQCVGEEIWVDSRTVYIGHKEPPPGAEAYIPQRYPDNRIVSSKVSEQQPHTVRATTLFIIMQFLCFIFRQPCNLFCGYVFKDDTFHFACIRQAVHHHLSCQRDRMIMWRFLPLCFYVRDNVILLSLCPTVYLLELHPQEFVWAVQKNRQLLLLGHISGPGEIFMKAISSGNFSTCLCLIWKHNTEALRKYSPSCRFGKTKLTNNAFSGSILS